MNLRTNQAQQAVTDARGRFRLALSSRWRLRADGAAGGFGSTRTALTLKVGDQIDLPIVLQAAAVTEAVQVEAAAPLVEARRTASVPRPCRRRKSTRCRSTAATTSTSRCSRPTCRARIFARPIGLRKRRLSQGTAVSISGQRNLANSFIVDGLSANDDAADLAGTFFSEEVVREFQVVTSGGVAEFGRASSGTVSVVTKSGSNNLTGRAYEFFRDDCFDARNPLSTRRDGSTNAPLKDPLRQNQYGLSMGGPIAKDRDVLVRQLRAHAARSHRHRHDSAGCGHRRSTACSTRIGYRGPEGDDRQLSDRLHHEQRVRPRRRSGDADARICRCATACTTSGSQNARNVGALNDVSRGAALDDTDQTVATSFLSTLSSGIDQRGARAIHAQRSGRAGERRHRPGRERQRRRELGHGHLLADRACARCRAGGRHGDISAWRPPRESRRGSALQPRDESDFPGALQGVYAFTSLANFRARRLLHVPAGVWRAVAVPVEPESRAVRAGRMARPTRSDGQRRHPLRSAVAAAAGASSMPTTSRHVSASRTRPAKGRPSFARAAASTSIGFRSARRRTPCSGTAASIRWRSSRSVSPALPVWPATLPVVSVERARVSHDDQSRHPGWTVRTGARSKSSAPSDMACRPASATTICADAQIIMSRNVNVPTLTAAAGQRHGHSESRAAEPRLRQHQPVRFDRRFVVRRADGVDADAVGSVGPRARLVHALEVARRCGQCVLPDTAGQRERPRRQGAVGQRSTSPRRH